MGGGRVKNRQFFGQHSLQTAPQDKRHLSKSTEIPHGKKTWSFFILLNGSSGLYPHHHSLIQFLPHVLKKRDVKKKTRQGLFQGHQKKQLVQSLLFVPWVGEGCLKQYCQRDQCGVVATIHVIQGPFNSIEQGHLFQSPVQNGGRLSAVKPSVSAMVWLHNAHHPWLGI